MPVPPDMRAVTRLDWRTNVAILVRMAVPVAALAVMALATPAVRADAPRPDLTAPGGVIIPGVRHPARPMRVEVVASYPHDRGAFTQGLLYHDGILYEGTGLEGESTIRRVDPTTGTVLQSIALAPDLFGGGVTLTPQGLVQLTWQNETGFLYDPATLAQRMTFKYDGNTWGLCYDGASLVTGDGYPVLAFRRPDTFEVHRTVRVTLDDAPLKWINELECVNAASTATSGGATSSCGSIRRRESCANASTPPAS